MGDTPRGWPQYRLMATVCSPISIRDVPEPALRRILVTVQDHANVLRYVSTCARVCAEWRRIVMTSAAYGHGLAGPRGGQAASRVN